MIKQLFIGDIHLPFHDRRALSACLTFALDWQPDEIHNLGDLVDLPAVSRFAVKHTDPQAWRITREIRQADDFLGRLREGFPKARLVFYQGNHETRLNRYLLTKAPELHGLLGTTLEEQFQTQKRRIRVVPYGQLLRLGSLYATHGVRISKHSGWSAKAHFEHYGTSIIHGHSHRGGVYYKTMMGRTFRCYENFCLLKLQQDYLESQPNWQQGWSACYNTMKRSFHMIPIPYERGAAQFEGQIIRATRKGESFVTGLGR